MGRSFDTYLFPRFQSPDIVERWSVLVNNLYQEARDDDFYAHEDDLRLLGIIQSILNSGRLSRDITYDGRPVTNSVIATYLEMYGVIPKRQNLNDDIQSIKKSIRSVFQIEANVHEWLRDIREAILIQPPHLRAVQVRNDSGSEMRSFVTRHIPTLF